MKFGQIFLNSSISEKMSNRRLLLAGLAAFAIAPKISQSQPIPTAKSKRLSRGFVTAYRQNPSNHFLPKTVSELSNDFGQILSSQNPFRIQSSGHCLAGFSQSSENLLDLRQLNAISARGNILTVGSGTTIQQVNYTLDRMNRMLPLGTCPTVAMGGLVSGGGIGAFSRQLGLTCDHLAQAEILLANGSLVVASKDQNADLFWALRGGGASSFGIVTKYSFNTLASPKPKFVRFQVKGKPNELSDWMHSLQNIVSEVSDSVDFHLSFRGRTDGSVTCQLDVTSLLPENQIKAIAVRIFNFGLTTQSPTIVLNSLRKIADALYPKGYKQTNLLVTGAFLQRIPTKAIWRAAFDDMIQDPRDQKTMTLHFLGGAIKRNTNSATAYAHRQAPAIVQYGSQTKHLAQYTDGYSRLSSLRRHFSQFERGAYVNYPDRRQKNFGNAYWSVNFSKLRQVKRKYDPQNVFNHPQSIPPA